MRIVMINGSPRTNGSTAEIMRVMQNKLQEKNVEIDFYNLSELKLNYCKGCCSCFKKEKRQYFLQLLVHRVVFNIGLKTFVLKKGDQYQGVIENWKKLSLLN